MVNTINYEEAPNVVSEEGCRQLVDTGWQMEVICIQSAEKRQAMYYGRWAIRVVSPDGRYERTLVTARKNMEKRLFKTINGLVSFLEDFRVKAPHIPLVEGMRTRQQIHQELD